MGPLRNVKHESFVQGIFQGKTGREAYLSAGYDCSPEAADAAASRLLKSSRVAARLASLQENISTMVVLTKKWVIEKTIALQQKAEDDKAYGPAAKCVELLAREVNTFIPKAEVGRPGDFDNLTDEELIDRISAITGEVRTSRAPRRRIGPAPDPKTLQ